MSDRRVGQAIAAGLVAAAAGALAWGWRRHGRGGGGAAGVEERTCECGQAFRVVGSGRHRVHWTAGAARDEAVLDGRCPTCERPLPS